MLKIKEALAFIGIPLQWSVLSPGFITKFLHVGEPSQHIGESKLIPSSTGLLTKENGPNDRYKWQIKPPRSKRFVAHDIVK